MGNGEKTELFVGLDFEKASKPTESSPSSPPYKRTMFSPPSSYLGGSGGGAGGTVASDIYDAVSSGGTAPALSSKPFNRGSMGSIGKAALFTASQLQELQRQTIICKYIMASIPVPPQLLLALSNNTSPALLTQSNTPGLDLKFSTGSDPEPWRCKRTDGKKWRCSRDVAPDQKYCERHAHKSRPRSRKPVEIPNINSSRNQASRNNNQHQSFQFPAVQFSAPSCEQTRYIEWLGRGDRSGTIPVINQQNMQQFLQTTTRMGFNNDQVDQNRRNTPAFQMQDDAKVYPLNLNHQYLVNRNNGQTLGSPLKNDDQCSDSIIASLQGRRTRDFIDSWSKDGLTDGVGNNGSFTSLTLSMSGWNNGMDDDSEHIRTSVGMLDSERSSDEVLRSQWLNPVSWMSSTAPGGPLGEALCLGNASNLASPHGYSNSTANSSCSFGSCENGSRGLDFIG